MFTIKVIRSEKVYNKINEARDWRDRQKNLNFVRVIHYPNYLLRLFRFWLELCLHPYEPEPLNGIHQEKEGNQRVLHAELKLIILFRPNHGFSLQHKNAEHVNIGHEHHRLGQPSDLLNFPCLQEEFTGENYLKEERDALTNFKRKMNIRKHFFDRVLRLRLLTVLLTYDYWLFIHDSLDIFNYYSF